MNYRIGLPYEGHWREAINTDAAAYGGSNMGNFGGVIARGAALARISGVGDAGAAAARDLVPRLQPARRG